MRSSLALTGSGLRLRALAAALVAISVAGCSADMGRLDGDPFARSTRSDAAPGSFTGAISRFSPAPELRPKADLLSDVRPAAVSGRANAPVRVAALGDQPVVIPRQDVVPRAAPAKRNAETVRTKNAKPARKSQVATARRSPPPVKIVVGKPADASVADTSAIFDWPVHGRLVGRFGAPRDGQRNSGIDIAVAEDTPITAAADGEVIYAGGGLKWYGNLALVRHADNYVTAYAHAKELGVKRGDQVKRGDIIGRSGQTGQADTPRLHFEIRKDSAPVDPMPLLTRGSASL
jgi:murein DD-endopeptidase MepM/ murein hydrolase activator NlpD